MKHSRPSMESMPTWLEGEEFLHALTHGFGMWLALHGLVLLVAQGVRLPVAALVGNIVFGLSMVWLYGVSLTYHAWVEPDMKKILRVVDHCSVFVLIAGSYTAICCALSAIHGVFVIYIFIAWFIALMGSIGKIFFFDVVDRYTVFLYVGMGWAILPAIGVVWRCLSGRCMAWLGAGGIVYTAGTFFYNREARYDHAIFHLFILAGTICQFVSIRGFLHQSVKAALPAGEG